MTRPAATLPADSLRSALERALEGDERVILLGGPHLAELPHARGLAARFDGDRVIEGPDDEAALIGLARGLALTGRRPVVDLTAGDGIARAFETLARDLAPLRYRSAGVFSAPMTLLVPQGSAPGAGPDLGATPESWLTTLPGLRVVCASAATAPGALLEASLDGGDPVALLLPRDGGAPLAADDGIALDAARVLRSGTELTLIAYGGAVATALDAADAAAPHAIEVLDLVSLAPIDAETLLASVARTGRAVVLQDAPRSHGVAAEVAALVAERAIEYLEAPVLRVAAPDGPAPMRLEENYRPDVARVLRAIEQVLDF
ncbi:MAG: transketolase C-terminal domain-containing protein [Planctomycetota bacterium]